MMIWLPGSLLYMFLFPKSFYFLGVASVLDCNLTLLSYLFFLVFLLVFLSLFNYVSLVEKLSYISVFFLVSFLLFFCYNSSNSVIFLATLESCVVLMIFCIFFFSKDVDKISSALFMFFLNIFPSVLFMFFCAFYYKDILCLFYDPVFSFNFFLFLCFLGLLLSKLPIFFLHFWLTKAHVSASGCGSMILASLLLKIGTVGIFKFYPIFLLSSYMVGSFTFSVVSFTLCFVVLIMIRFFDLKYLVACSSIVHMAPIFPSTLMGYPKGIFCSFLMKVGHGLVSFIIFYLVTLVYEKGQNRSMDYNKSLYSLSSTLYLSLVFFFTFNLGFPPLPSFISELFFLSIFFDFSLFSLLLFSISLVVGGVFFFFILSKPLYGKKIIFFSTSSGTFNLLVMLIYAASFFGLSFFFV